MSNRRPTCKVRVLEFKSAQNCHLCLVLDSDSELIHTGDEIKIDLGACTGFEELFSTNAVGEEFILRGMFTYEWLASEVIHQEGP